MLSCRAECSVGFASAYAAACLCASAYIHIYKIYSDVACVPSRSVGDLTTFFDVKL